MRIRNESRFILKSLERTWQVASRVVILDDGSTDDTEIFAIQSLGVDAYRVGGTGMALQSVWRGDEGGMTRELHFLRSPFANDAVRSEERVHEIRDKNFLWDYMRANVSFEHVLCLDGDEWLSLEALRTWPKIVAALDGGIDYVLLPFVYLWDGAAQQRIDGIYGPEVDGDGCCMPCASFAPFVLSQSCASPRHKRLRFPRVFSIQRLQPRELFDTHFAWTGTRGGFHCGSTPNEGFRPLGAPPVRAFAEAPVIHGGYIDDALRQTKVAFYRALDPNNIFEGDYCHCLGEPDQHAPGPVRLAQWEDR